MAWLGKSVLTNLIFVFALFFSLGAHAAPNDAAEAAKTKFKIERLHLGKKTVFVEMADDYEKREQGLMFRTSLANDRGMLFVFDTDNVLNFWMKNTLIPLSIGYFNKDKKLVKIHEMIPAIAGEAMPKTYGSIQPCMYALEMPKGWFAANKIEPGATFSFIQGGDR